MSDDAQRVLEDAVDLAERIYPLLDSGGLGAELRSAAANAAR